eukprot:493290_1
MTVIKNAISSNNNNDKDNIKLQKQPLTIPSELLNKCYQNKCYQVWTYVLQFNGNVAVYQYLFCPMYDGYHLCMIDLFDDWLEILYCPNEAKDLFETYGSQFEEMYCKYELRKEYKKQVKARELWTAILQSQID